MNKKQMLRMSVDFSMTVILLLLVGYSRIGETAHEWLGITMVTLFVIHHILNRRWIAAIFRGRYTPYRVLQTALVALLLLTMLGSAVSGIVVSKHVFTFIGFRGTSLARSVHMLCGYWNFVLMSLHLGLHWVMIVGMVSKKMQKKPALTWAARIAAVLIAGYGVFALISRSLHEYLFGITQFAFIDLREPIVLFLLDYIVIMGLFVFIGHYASKLVKTTGRKNHA